MSAETPSYDLEKHETVKDNDRKFILTARPLDVTFWDGYNPDREYDMTVHWTDINDDEKTETKIAHKLYDDGAVEILKIAKVKVGDDRTAKKHEVAPDDYEKSIQDPVKQLAKRRYEFAYRQNGAIFKMKYDVIEDGILCMLEVGAGVTEQGDVVEFDMSAFEDYQLYEVSGDPAYEGHRIVDTIARLKAQ